MRKTPLLLTLGLAFILTGCRSDDAGIVDPERETLTTVSETVSAVSTELAASSVSEESSQIMETTAPQPDVIATETLLIMQDTYVSETKSEEATAIEETASQLETLPDDSPIEEDTGDFGELFS